MGDVTTLSFADVSSRRFLRTRHVAALEPTERFLVETLIRRPALMSRKEVSYLSIRRWRSSIKPYQIEAMQALKTAPSPRFVNVIAEDIMHTVGCVLGCSVYCNIVAVPCSRSPAEACLSQLVADALAHRVHAKVIKALHIDPATGASHPKSNVRRKRMRLIEHVDKPTLLIDDVATSGQHLEEAALLLRSATTPVLAVAWIGGQAAD